MFLELLCKTLNPGLETELKGMVFHQRYSNNINFASTAQAKYLSVKGFGSDVNFWRPGLKGLFELTNGKSCQLVVELEDTKGNKCHATYKNFGIGSGINYPLKYGSFSGTCKNQFELERCHSSPWSGNWWKNCPNSNLNNKWGTTQMTGWFPVDKKKKRYLRRSSMLVSCE